MLTLRTITTAEDFASLKDEWNRLLLESPQNNVFLTWEWLYTWWQVYGNGKDLWILLIQDSSGRYVGAAPLCWAYESVFGLSLKCLKFIGSEEVCSEYLDIIVHKDASDEVKGLMTKSLSMALSKADVLDFVDLREDAFVLELLSSIQKGKKLYHQRSVATTNPYVTLPDTGDDYLRGLSHNRRSSIKRKERKLAEQHGYQFLELREIQDLKKDFAPFVQLHDQLWESRGRPGVFRREKFLQFHETVAQRMGAQGWLAMYYLLVNQVPVASLYGFWHRDKFFFYQSGSDPGWRQHGVGIILMKHSICDSIKKGGKEYDFLRGQDEYKFQLASQLRHTVRVVIGARSFKLGCRIWKDRLRRRCKRFIKKLLTDSLIRSVRNMRENYWLKDKKMCREP